MDDINIDAIIRQARFEQRMETARQLRWWSGKLNEAAVDTWLHPSFRSIIELEKELVDAIIAGLEGETVKLWKCDGCRDGQSCSLSYSGHDDCPEVPIKCPFRSGNAVWKEEGERGR